MAKLDPHKHDSIEQAALELFTEVAFASTTVPLIAARAGVATGTIYRYFPSKEALANAVFQREKNAMKDALVAARHQAALLEESGSPGLIRQEIDLYWKALLSLLSERRLGVLFIEGQQHAAYLDERSRALASEVDALALDVVRRGQAAGAIRATDPVVLVAMFFGAFVGLAKSTPHIEPDVAAATADAAWDLVSRKDTPS